MNNTGIYVYDNISVFRLLSWDWQLYKFASVCMVMLAFCECFFVYGCNVCFIRTSTVELLQSLYALCTKI